MSRFVLSVFCLNFNEILGVQDLPESFEKHPLVRFPYTMDNCPTFNVMMDAIKRAQKSISLYVYQIDDMRFLDALKTKVAEGICVRVIYEPQIYSHAYTKILDLGAILKERGIDFRIISGSNKRVKMTHAKVLLIDTETEEDGWGMVYTANLDSDSLPGTSKMFPEGTRDFGLVVTHPEDVKTLATMFQADWEDTPYTPTNHNCVFGPHAQRTTIKQTIESAQKSLDIYAVSVQDDALVHSICAQAEKGIAVRLITMPYPFGPQDPNLENLKKLQNTGVKLYFFPHDISKEDNAQQGDLYMHAKCFLVDAQRLFVTSCNMYPISMDNDREIGIFTQDPAAIADFKTAFETDVITYCGTAHPGLEQ